MAATKTTTPKEIDPPVRRRFLGSLHERWVGLGVLAVFGVMILCLLSPSLLGGKILTSGDAIFFISPFTSERAPSLLSPSNAETTDPVMVFQPDLIALRRGLENGELGLWTSDQAGGRPLWASQQAAPLYPLTWLALIFSFWRSLAWIAALKLFVTALGAYAFARWAGLRRGPAILTGTAYAFCAYSTDGLQFPTSDVMSMTPWVMLMVGRVARLGRSIDTLGLILAVGLMFLTGEPEMIAIAFGGVIAYALFELLRRPLASEEDTQASRWRRLALLVVGAIGGVTLSGAVLFPFVEFLGVANSTSRAGLDTYPNSIAYAFFFPELWGRPDKAIGQFGPINYTERTAYLGAFPLLLAIGGVFARRPRGQHLFWTLFTAIVVLISLRTFLHNLVGDLPGPDHVKLLRTFLLVELGGALLAGFGLQTWLELNVRQRKQMTTAMVFALLMPVAFLLRHADPFSHFVGAIEQLPSLGNNAIAQKSFIKQIVAWRWLVFGGAGIVLLAISRRIPQVVAMMAMVALVATDLITLASGFNPQIPLAQANPPTPSAVAYVQSHVGHQRVSGMAFAGNAGLPANLAERYSLRDIQTYDFPETSRWARLWEAYGQAIGSQNDWNSTTSKSHAVLDAFAVKYVFPPVGVRGPSWLKPVYGQVQGAPVVLENATALPRAWIAYDWRSASSQSSATALTVASSTSQLYRAPILEDTRQPAHTQASLAPGIVNFIVDSDEHVELRANVIRPGYLILDDSYYPGWKATVDGRPARIVPANENFRAVAVGPGMHTIGFSYRSGSFRLGAVLSILTCVALVIGLMVIIMRRRRRMGS